jgi:8-oxo-dGTP diphosphatase
VREWTVAGGLIQDDGQLLLVQNRRRNGALDWSPPGGVIEIADGESLLDGLTREVEEETGLRVTEWLGPLYQVDALAPDLGWHLHAEVHLAVGYEGALEIADPDGIVVDARFVAVDECGPHLDRCHPWVREPLSEWLASPWAHDAPPRPFSYRVDGRDFETLVVTRLT